VVQPPQIGEEPSLWASSGSFCSAIQRLNHIMWKIVLAFIAFAALALFALKKGGADLDMSGEKHGIDTPPAASAPAAPASAASK